MYGRFICPHEWLQFMVNAGKHTTHGSYEDVKVPSQELTYPLSKSLLKMMLIFLRWDILVPRRVILEARIWKWPCFSNQGTRNNHWTHSSPPKKKTNKLHASWWVWGNTWLWPPSWEKCRRCWPAGKMMTWWPMIPPTPRGIFVSNFIANREWRKFVEISDGTWMIIRKLGFEDVFFYPETFERFTYIYIYILRLCWIIHGRSPTIASFLTWTHPESIFFRSKSYRQWQQPPTGPSPGWRWKRRRIQEEKCLSGNRVVGEDVGCCWWSN